MAQDDAELQRVPDNVTGLAKAAVHDLVRRHRLLEEVTRGRYHLFRRGGAVGDPQRAGQGLVMDHDHVEHAFAERHRFTPGLVRLHQGGFAASLEEIHQGGRVLLLQARLFPEP